MAYLAHSKTYPYIVLRANTGIYRIFKAPEIDSDNLLSEAERLQEKYHRRVCAVFAPNGCIYLELDGTGEFSRDIPAGDTIIDPEYPEADETTAVNSDIPDLPSYEELVRGTENMNDDDRRETILLRGIGA